MKVNIVCWNLKDKINLSDISSVFKDMSNENEEMYFLKFEDKSLKIIMSNGNNEDFEQKCLNLEHDKNLIIMIKELNFTNIDLIKKLLLVKSCNVIVGKNNIDNEEINKSIIIAPQLYYEEKGFDFKAFLLTLNRFYENDKLNLDEVINKNIIVGSKDNDDNIGEIPLFLLKKFNYMNIENYRELNLYMFIRKEFNYLDLTYIEDPLQEYLPYGCMLNITQTIMDKFNKKIYFSLIAK